MVYQATQNLLKTSILASVLGLAACGGGGSGSDDASAAPVATAALSDEVSVSGRAVKGVIKQGLVTAYRIQMNGQKNVASSVVGSPVRTDSEGYYSINLPRSVVGEQIVFEVTADEQTRMTCEATSGCSENGVYDFGEDFTPGADLVLSSVSPVLESVSDNSVHVTPFTHMVRVKAEYSDSGLTIAATQAAQNEIEGLFDLEQGALLREPIDITEVEERSSASAERVKLSSISAGMHELANGGAYDGVTDVLEEIEMNLKASGSLVLFDKEGSSTVAVDELVYAAQGVISDVTSLHLGQDESNYDQLVTELVQVQNSAMDQGALVQRVQIMTQPVGVVTEAGERVSLTANIIGGLPMSYQWFKDGELIEGATTSALVLGSVSINDSGAYSLRVSNPSSVVTSATAEVVVQVLSADDENASQPDDSSDSTDDQYVADNQNSGDSSDDANSNDGQQSNGGSNDTSSRSISLSWDIPVEREDGSDLELYEINGYVIKYGSSAGGMANTINISGGNVTQYTLDNLNSGTYYFAIATVDSDDVQGEFSSTISAGVN
ncbi:hypothetical protein A3715_09040 [Oleiphilus sp. HI0009]|nr:MULTISPECIES: immunoglobulin domain-containing protein [unclassified Oleiphilus]KZX78961.1 hypothetical protein A3715_09040 [Oleiphilus sp. HI0009]KZY66023.1 hypothetical protein A3738_00775 [Oleiphilus sp. HI0066]KZY73393.1 hypothetical protein A3739_15330 [Oleiphilus sp. HI0067]